MPALRNVAATLLFSAALAGCAPGVLNAPGPGPSGEYPLAPSSSRIELQLDHGQLSPNGIVARTANYGAVGNLRAWVDRAAEAISLYYGQFPVEHARLLVEPVNGSGVQWARTFSNSGFFIRVGIGTTTSASQLAGDWMLTHEFVHLSLPTLADEHDWFQEGAATYVEPVARAQAGQVSPERVWAAFVHQMPHGLPGPNDHGLDSTAGWGRTYWGGALFCLTADIEIRKQTDNRYGLREALRGILNDGGTLDHRWTIREALAAGDRAVGAEVLTQMYERWRASPMRVDLEALWLQLGVQRDGRGVRLDDSAPLARIRQAITARATVPEADGESMLSLTMD
jgi:hypothetical protein